MTTRLAIAFLPLVDCAVLAVAREKGFAAGQGLELSLVRDTSWATVRDRLVYGQIQAAQMLAPLAVGVTLGLSQHRAALVAPFKLGLNGNVVTLSHVLTDQLSGDRVRRALDPAAAAIALADAIRKDGRSPILGVVHRFSSHALMLRYWLASAGLEPGRDFGLRVLPPSVMVDALGSGEIQGFCAGEPWGTIAVDAGVGEVVAIGARIWERGVDKLLTLRSDWAEANPETVDRLVRALDAAAAWCDDPANRVELAEILARDAYVGTPAESILPALSGRMRLDRTGDEVDVPDFLIFHREAANFPWRSQALWIYSQFLRWGFVEADPETEAAAAAVFRPDIYRRALKGSRTPLPGASAKVEGALTAPLAVGSVSGRLTLGPDRFFDGRIFDPDGIESYLASF